MFVLKNVFAPELSEADSRARLSYWKELLENIHWMMVSSLWFTDKNMYNGTPKNLQNDIRYARRKTLR